MVFFWRCFAVSLPLSFSLLLVFRGWWKEGWEGSQKQEAIASEPQGPGKEKKNFPHPPQQARRLVGKFWRLVGKLTISWAGRESLRRDGARLVGTSWEAIQNHFD